MVHDPGKFARHPSNQITNQDGVAVMTYDETSGVANFPAGARQIVAVDNVTEAAPTDAELDAAFGTPASLGNGFIGIISDNDAATASILCWTSKGAWFHVVGTKST